MSDIRLKNLCNDTERYAKAFRVFAKASSKYEVLENWTDSVFANEVLRRINNVTEKRHGHINMLGIGSGTGEMDCKMIAKLLTKFSTITNTVLEPARNHIEKYKASSIRKNLTAVEWDFRPITWEYYCQERERTNDKTKFDFISAIHALCYVTDLESTLLNIHDYLEDGGMSLIILISENSGTRRLWNKFPILQDAETFHHRDCRLVQDIYKKHNIECHVTKQTSCVDITSCYEKGQNVEDQLLVDFLTQVVNFKETAPPQLYSDVFDFLSGSECSIRKGDRILLNNSWEAVVVKKSK